MNFKRKNDKKKKMKETSVGTQKTKNLQLNIEISFFKAFIQICDFSRLTL